MTLTPRSSGTGSGPGGGGDGPTPDRPARPGRRPSAAKRSRILEAATDAFLSLGFAGTSMDAVAAAAEVSKQTVYGHFTDKTTLFYAVVEAVRGQAAPQPGITHSPLTEVEDLRAGLVTAGVRWLRVILEPRLAALRRLVLFEAATRPELQREWDGGAPSRFVVTLADEFDALHDQGRLDVPDPMTAARQLVALWAYDANERSFGGVHPLTDSQLHDVISAGVDMFLRAYGHRPEPVVVRGRPRPRPWPTT